MARYQDQPFSQRLATMGDIAERVLVEVVATEREWRSLLGPVVRLGWNRPIVSMSAMLPPLRSMPDYYGAKGHLIEVVGLGADGVLKIRVDKWEGLKWWRSSGQPLWLFVWNSHLRRYAFVSWPHLVRLVGRARRAGIATFESDGNRYYPIRWEWIEAVSASYEWDPQQET